MDAQLASLGYPFPKPEELRAVLECGTRTSRETIVRLWISEGVPFAFQKCPAIFESIRGWLGARLDVHPKEITLIGSARIGYSLASVAFGKPFGEHSDLDFSVISPAFFARLENTFRDFSDDYKSGQVFPRNNREKRFWDDHIIYGPRNINKGFLDSKRIPNLDRYPVAKNVSQSMWALEKRIRDTPEIPNVRTMSARVYRDWQCFVDQASLNLKLALSELKKA
ncbi:MAG: hypothetical protein GEU92_05910 [Alphaproteobacteria bacterium]|nr:hypothetical protein [Alphaproteobacteria bacterium]